MTRAYVDLIDHILLHTVEQLRALAGPNGRDAREVLEARKAFLEVPKGFTSFA